MKYNEGSLVSCNSKIKIEEAHIRNGTIIKVLESQYMILDALGYLHVVSESETYPYQEGLMLPEEKKEL